MELPKNTIRNPLTIIAIFAAISEISGSVVLPMLPVNIQSTFVWFVMSFPVLLVILFFSVLVLKHHVLYAPSDFKSDESFSSLIKRIESQSPDDIIEKRKYDDYDGIHNHINDQTKAVTSIIKNPDVEYFIAEELALKKLVKKYGDSFMPQKSFEINGSRFSVDGLINTSEYLSIFEIKYFPRLNTTLNGIGKTYKYFEEIVKNYPKKDAKHIILNLVIVTPINVDQQKLITNKLDDFLRNKELKFNIDIFNFEELKREYGL